MMIRLTGTNGSPTVRGCGGRGVATCGPRHVLPSFSCSRWLTSQPQPRSHVQAFAQKGRNIVVAVDEDEVSVASILAISDRHAHGHAAWDWAGTPWHARVITGPKLDRGHVMTAFHHHNLCLLMLAAFMGSCQMDGGGSLQGR